MASDPLPSFALAKIQPPRSRAGLVERPGLEAALDSAVREYRLTLLVAPAGYGKTAALTQQIRRLPATCALAWVSADEDDRVQRFLACLTTALEPHDLPWRVAPEALGTLAQAENGLRGVAGELVNALASAEVERGLIVVDDAHRITDPRVFELLQAVLDRLPDHWGVAIASRVDPPLSLARWRAGGELAEFRQYDLRFNEQEVSALASSSGHAASGAASRELLERTDGWAVGLRLTLSARPGGPLRGPGAPTQRHLFDYLASEVLDDMPADLRWFLLRCAVLPELTALRCEHVSRLPRAARHLEEVERRGLFVATLDAPELTLRLHDLFRDFLEDRLQRDHPEELPHLLRRAADDEPDLSRAVGYLTRAGAWDEAARVLAERGPALVAVGGGPALEQMLALLPDAQFERHADLHLLRGLTTFPRFDFDGMVSAMQRAAAGYERAGRDQDAALARAYACLGMQNTGHLAQASHELARLRERTLADGVRAFVCFASAWAAYAQARSDEVAPQVAAMLDALERCKDPQVWDRCFFTSILAGLPGMKPLLARFAQGALRLAGDTPTQLHASAMHIRAWLAMSDGGIDEAAQWLARADEDVRWLGRPRSLMTESWMSHTLIDAVRGDRDASYTAARENKRDLEEHSLLSNRLTHEYEELFTFIRAAWILGDAATLRSLDAAIARTGNPCEWSAAADDRRFSSALVALADGRLEPARELLLPLAADIERSCFFPAAQATMLLADVELRLGLIDAAAATLRPWLAAVADGGDVGGAFLAGLPALQRLATVPWGDRLPAEDQALLLRLAQSMQAAQVAPGGEAPTPVRHDDAAAPAPEARRVKPLVGLSDRECEVLARMAAGDSNKLIARALDLSPHTVKRHVANILDKLGADTRGQAAARWRDLS
ncbi:LuxR C-terminal-related transcriptional regulator [Piscinibacter sp.]|uniref:LuxR C-terminal-related transcriptional regulator n=1 Tax=Piscinibacter sp. TaxID=1903157 RepID=UPI002C9001A1|nr:LuxR C-terminal-related transcriptional regulator [Albitalea sp.]HUG24222.1 LuxR C-terminal-related transcriptional regulator [Albitalea sp.]